MHLALDVVAERRRARGEQLRDVGSKLPGGGIDDLKFFLDADGERVIHEVPVAVPMIVRRPATLM
jgi:hypothetical protein